MRVVFRIMTEKYIHTDLSGIKSTKIEKFIYELALITISVSSLYVRVQQAMKELKVVYFVALLPFCEWWFDLQKHTYLRRDGCVELLELYKLIGQIRKQRTECASFLRYTYFSCTLYFSSSLITAKRVSTLVTCLGNLCKLNTLNAELNPVCHLLALLGVHHILHVSRIRVNSSEDFLTAICNVVGAVSSRNS